MRMGINAGGCCCCGGAVKSKQVDIGGVKVGIVGLDEIFSEVYGCKMEDEEGLKKELVKRAAIYNYIPESVKEVYGNSLLREYKKYCRREGEQR